MERLNATDALVVADVQNDFLPGGSLAIQGAEAIVPVVNRYLALAGDAGATVVVARDWHPEGHVSFRERGGPWPRHCVAGTHGAELARDLAVPETALRVSKGTDLDRDAYSAFEGTDLERRLRARSIRRLLVAGLATEYCVLRTVRDALARGFEARVLVDAVRGVDLAPGDSARALDEMRALGASPLRVSELER
jgi:nicotinamidase/pyrazinamidase